MSILINHQKSFYLRTCCILRGNMLKNRKNRHWIIELLIEHKRTSLVLSFCLISCFRKSMIFQNWLGEWDGRQENDTNIHFFAISEMGEINQEVRSKSGQNKPMETFSSIIHSYKLANWPWTFYEHVIFKLPYCMLKMAGLWV